VIGFRLDPTIASGSTSESLCTASRDRAASRTWTIWCGEAWPTGRSRSRGRHHPDFHMPARELNQGMVRVKMLETGDEVWVFGVRHQRQRRDSAIRLFPQRFESRSR